MTKVTKEQFCERFIRENAASIRAMGTTDHNGRTPEELSARLIAYLDEADVARMLRDLRAEERQVRKLTAATTSETF